MIKDNVYKEDRNKVIEILTEKENGVQVWIPMSATVLFLLTNDSRLKRVVEVRVRDLSKE